MKTTIDDMSLEELEAIMQTKKAAAEKQRKKAEEEYIIYRDNTICKLAAGAIRISMELEEFMLKARKGLDIQQRMLNEYGKIRGNSKGGFSIESSDGMYRVVRQYRAISDYDERADKAAELLKDFLQDKVKKKDQDLFDLIMSLLERNKAGRLEYSRVQSLYQHEAKYDDPRWIEAIRLFKESFKQTGTKYSIFFYKKDEEGVFQPIPLNFSNL